MIEKRGNKTDRTVLMENAVQRFFEKKYEIEMSPEVRLYNGGYADLCGWIKDKNDEIRDFIVVEIKQSHNDFYSGYGLNFVGMSNYIAVPPELVGFSIEFLREEGFGFVGVLEVDSRCFVREVIRPETNPDSDYTKARYKKSMVWYFIPPLHLLENWKERIQ